MTGQSPGDISQLIQGQTLSPVKNSSHIMLWLFNASLFHYLAVLSAWLIAALMAAGIRVLAMRSALTI